MKHSNSLQRKKACLTTQIRISLIEKGVLLIQHANSEHRVLAAFLQSGVLFDPYNVGK